MANDKMTQVQALETAVTVWENDPEMADVVAVFNHMLEVRRNRSTKPRINKEAEAFRKELLDAMEELGFPATNAELTALMNADRAEDALYKPQKVANNIRVLEKAGKVARIRGEKASDKDTFALV